MNYSERHQYVVSIVTLAAWREFLQLCAKRFDRMKADMEVARRECQRLFSESEPEEHDDESAEPPPAQEL